MSDSDLASILDKSLNHHRAGELDDAEAGYIAILAKDPEHLEALHLMSVLRLQQGDAAEALEYADAVVRVAPEAAEAYGNKGNALQALERYGEAAFAFRTAIKHAPDIAHHHYNLGNTLRAADDKEGAVAAYRDAVRLAPELVQAHSNLSTTLAELGLFDEAAAHCHIAIRHNPNFADAHYNLGNAHREAGRFQDAIEAYNEAIRLNPDYADAYCNLGLTEMITKELPSAIVTLGKSIHADASQDMARFYHAVASEMMGANAEPLFNDLPRDDETVTAWLDSWTYVKSNSDLKTEIIHDPFALLTHAFNAAENDGLVMEFGVRHGVSIRHLADQHDGPIYGFDSFKGLPSAWGGEREGVYSTDGKLPDVPDNVTLIEGLFEDTLEPFLARQKGDIKFCNIDCDLYASTRCVLDAIAPRVKPGSVLVFDEYLINPTWREDEHQAFQEAAAGQGWSYRYVSFGIVTKQAAVIITET